MGQDYRAAGSVSSIPYGFDRHGRRVRSRRFRKDLSIAEGFRYPVVDGPGIALLVFLPPFLAIMAFPVFDMLVHIKPGNVLNPISLLILPFTLPLVVSFTLTIGYILIYLGRVLTTSALGEVDHPRFPIWDRVEILEELARWTWAILIGAGVGAGPAWVYWTNCGDVDQVDRAILCVLTLVGAAYVQLALAASLLHDSMIAANPVTVCRSIYRLRRDYLGTGLVTGLAFVVDVLAWWGVLLHSPNLEFGIVGLWACWVLTLYLAMLAFRMIGTLYYQHSERLGWFQTSRNF